MLDLLNWAEHRHFKVAWGDTASRNQSMEKFEEMFASNRLNILQVDKYREWSAQEYPNGSVILIAYSTAGQCSRITLDFDGDQCSVFLPPCYGDAGRSWEYELSIEKDLAEYLAGYGIGIQRLNGPYKNLSVRLGLGKYGRNNLIYVDGWGSYIRIVGFVTNTPLYSDAYPGNESDETHLELCAKCRLCRNNCPSQAIRDDRFQLDVDRCLSYQNENVEFWPNFVWTAENECLVGCVICQNVCPYNRGFTDAGILKNECFDRDETDYILGKSEEMSESITKRVFRKFEGLGLARYQDFILRNIRAIVQRDANKAG